MFDSRGFVAWMKWYNTREYYVVFAVKPHNFPPYLCVMDDYGNLVAISNRCGSKG